MNLNKFILPMFLAMAVPVAAPADSLFFEDEPVQNGINVIDASKTFADIYEKLDGVRWGGRNINVAVESLEKLNPHAHIAATDERVVLVWDDAIVANFPRPAARDWNGFGEITTALVLQLRARDDALRRATPTDLYKKVVETLTRGIDENGRYIPSHAAQVMEDNRMLTTVGLTGARDSRGNFRVNGVFKGSPADAAGVSAGDLIVGINGRATSDMDDADLAASFDGFNSGTAKIKLLSPSGNRDVVLRRATVVVADADVVHRSGDNAGDILEIVIHNITDNSVSIVSEALGKYGDAAGIILDMRSSGGNDERAAAKLAGLFIGQTPVMRIAQTALEEVEVVPGGNAVTKAPVVVLMSDQTRGTAEAVVAAFYENARGVLVGTPTRGAARIATRIDLDSGAALELLNRSIKTGSGREIDGRGVFPIVCLSNIRSASQQNAFFLNVINNDFNAQDFNKQTDIPADTIRRGCPVISSGTDEDALSAAVAAKILTDKKVYNNLIAQ